MNARSALSALAFWAAAGFTSPVVGQRHASVGFGAGLVGPTGTLASEVGPGWQITGMWDVPLGAQIGSFRIELSYVRFRSSAAGQAPSMWPLLFTLAAEFPGKAVRPALVGGLGIYHFRISNPEFTDSKFGLNVGAGARWRRLSLEGRYHSVFTRGDTYWGLSVGLRP